MPVRFVVLQALLEGGRPGVARRLVLVPGPSAGGPERLSGDVADALIECERAYAATVLLAADPADLDGSVAAVCRYVATDRPDVAEEARLRFGSGRVHVVESVDPAYPRVWIGALAAAIGPIPAPRGRRGGTGGWIMLLRAAYGRIRERNTRSRGAGRETS